LTLEETDAVVRGLQIEVAAIGRRLNVSSGALCTAERTHPGKLTFIRGVNEYICECGQVYRKDGQGGLQEVA